MADNGFSDGTGGHTTAPVTPDGRTGTGPTVAVHCGTRGSILVDWVRGSLPDCIVVESGTPQAADAEVLATLAGDDCEGIDRDLTPSVRWVHVLGAGIDRFPLDVVGDRVLTCSRGASSPAIAEFVMASMLAFEKQLPEQWITEPPGQWNAAALGGLEGRTLGLVGLGAIGTEVARRALAFDMSVLALRRSDRPAPLDGVELAPDLGTLLSAADHVVVAAPATARTVHLLDAESLALLKPGAHVVNVARGTLVDNGALLAALDDGRIARATLDVVDPEPLPAGHPLYTHPRVRLTPHISWSAPRTLLRTMELFVADVDRYRSGQPLLGTVDLQEGY
ncbi:MAG: NAD(P)-dependent oxidoreductase [Acidimicrobiales bacterium]|jgi:phosphoglycerate dehydrogenase-like enzyme